MGRGGQGVRKGHEPDQGAVEVVKKAKTDLHESFVTPAPAPTATSPSLSPNLLSATGLSSCLLWPSICLLPLAIGISAASPLHYTRIFSKAWWDPEVWQGQAGTGGGWPSPLGLSLGIAAVAVGQVFVIGYHYLRWRGKLGGTRAIQRRGATQYAFSHGVATHLSQPEGFVLLGLYLTGTWMLQLMPRSYYSFEGGINWPLVLVQLLLQEGFQYAMHMLEHKLSPALYRASHKPHHRFTNPRLFDAYNGSATDTCLMILLPLFLTAQCARQTNVWTYMTFGSLYANWLTLIHCEWAHPWDLFFRRVGFGTAADHHVHHRLFTYNYGHLFMYYDWAFGTYKDPGSVEVFNLSV